VIFHGLRITDDPDEIDYYEKARAFPIVYSPDDNPEVIEEMKVVAAELKDGGDNSDENEIEDSSGSPSEDSTDSSEGESAEDEWVDEGMDVDREEEAAPIQPKKSKGRQKVFSCVKKVHQVRSFK
jgi:hypothetical protein